MLGYRSMRDWAGSVTQVSCNCVRSLFHSIFHSIIQFHIPVHQLETAMASWDMGQGWENSAEYHSLVHGEAKATHLCTTLSKVNRPKPYITLLLWCVSRVHECTALASGIRIEKCGKCLNTTCTNLKFTIMRKT